MRSQASGLHAGQLRYHDFSKLREIHHDRLAAAARGRISSPFLTTSLLGTTMTLSQNRFLLNSTRSFSMQSLNHLWSKLSRLSKYEGDIRHFEIKELEFEANQAPHDDALQYRFLAELAAADEPHALIARVTHPSFANCALNRGSAILYLQALQRTGQQSQLHADTLLRRIEQTYSPLDAMAGITAERLQQWKHALQEQRLDKAGQTGYLLSLLTNGGVAAAAGAGASAGTAAMASSPLVSSAYSPPMNQMMTRGVNPNKPIYVQVAQPSGTLRGAVFRLLGSAVLVLVSVSALGALLDEKGLGRGLPGAGSKHIQEAEHQTVKFDDVKGVEEAKAELEEIVMYLKDPSRFTRLGGKLPRGLLLTGPPGTGKTLAKAIAGEANVPFFFSSGSSFEEVYVGLGAKRVRELFEAAKQKAPAIIFIDEIDAVGGTRKLKDQSALKMTLNELLVQLDGFDENNGIIVIGATNFAESLDKALLRPGRFDKHVVVPLPDIGGRKEILEMYAKKTLLASDVDLNVLARGTTGFSGADLYNLVNQAALKASVDGLSGITMAVFEYAKDKIMMGAERRTAVITAETAKCTAYHEAGHALVATLTKGANPIHKATIMPRGNSLGMVTMLPEGDQTSQSLKEMLASMDVAMGGRVAEELVFGREQVTSGAMSDIQHATNVARAMVTKFGFSDQVGLVFYGGSSGEENASNETRARIDQEVKRLTDDAYKRAKELLAKHSDEHRLLAETLLEYETLTGDEVRDLVHKRIKPNRPVINKKGGSRGDTSVFTNKGGDKGTKGRLFGKNNSTESKQ